MNQPEKLEMLNELIVILKNELHKEEKDLVAIRRDNARTVARMVIIVVIVAAMCLSVIYLYLTDRIPAWAGYIGYLLALMPINLLDGVGRSPTSKVETNIGSLRKQISIAESERKKKVLSLLNGKAEGIY